jgi:dihydropyrimidinase
MHHGADYTPYEGQVVTGWPIMTILRGKVVMEEGKILGAPGDGSFLKRDLSPYAARSDVANS